MSIAGRRPASHGEAHQQAFGRRDRSPLRSGEPMPSRRPRVVLLTAVSVVLGAGAALVPAGAAPTPSASAAPASAVDLGLFRAFSELTGPETTKPGKDPVVKVLSNRADLVSGGDALVEVVPPAGASTSAVWVTLGGRDATRAFGVRRTDGRIDRRGSV